MMKKNETSAVLSRLRKKNLAKGSEGGRKMLCHFRFHSTSLSNNAAGIDFKAFWIQGENKNKYLFCGLLCFNMAAR